MITERESAQIITNEIQYHKTQTRLIVVISVCFILLVILTASFIITKVSQDQFNTVQLNEQKQGQVVEQKLCTTLEALKKIPPPGKYPPANPSQAYLQDQHDKLAQLSADIGCKG